MGFDLNSCVFTGGIGQDAEVKTLDTGKAFTVFGLAVSGFKDSTMWLNCTAWGKTGEMAAELLKKGTKVAVSGELTMRTSEKDGQKRTFTGLNVRNFSVQKWPAKPSGGGDGNYAKHAHPEGEDQSSEPPPDDNYPF